MRHLTKPQRLIAAAAGVAAVGTSALAASRRAKEPAGRQSGAAQSGDLIAPYRVDRVVSGDGTALAVRTYTARDARPIGRVLLAHGWGMTARFWHWEALALVAEGFEVVTYDQRGHGLSLKNGEHRHDVGDLGADVAAVLEFAERGGTQPTWLVGHSMGAMSIVQWAAMPNSDVGSIQGVVLANTAYRGVSRDAVKGIFRTTSAAVRRLSDRGMALKTPLPVSPITRGGMRFMAHGPRAPRASVDLTAELFCGTNRHVRAAFVSSIQTMDLTPYLSELKVPTLVISGARDRLTPPGQGRRMAERISGATYNEVEGAGHQFPVDDPVAFHDIVRAHISATGSPSVTRLEVSA